MMSITRSSSACLVAAALILGLVGPELPSATASGLYLPGHGAKQLGRGATGTVSAWDINALWYNPALLAGIEGHHFMLDLTIIDQSTTFERAPRSYDSGEVRNYPSVSNEAPPTTIPQLGFASNFGTERFVFGIGIFGPNGVRNLYPEDGPQRYVIIDTEDSLLLFTEIAGAMRITDSLWFGAGIQNVGARVRTVNVVSAYAGVFGDPEDKDLDMLFQATVDEPINITGNLGLWAEPVKSFQLGLSVQLPLHIEDEDVEFEMRLPSHPFFDDAEVSGDTIGTSLDLPMIVRGGTRYVGSNFDIELNLVYEQWSVFKNLSTDPQNVEINGIYTIGTFQAQPLDVPLNFKDTWSVRLGGDFKTNDWLTLRAGSLFEQSAVPEKNLSVFAVDMDKFSISAGATFDVAKSVAIDVGYAHLFYFGTEVAETEVVQLNPTNAEGALAVGAGTYTTSANLFGVGVRTLW